MYFILYDSPLMHIGLRWSWAHSTHLSQLSNTGVQNALTQNYFNQLYAFFFLEYSICNPQVHSQGYTMVANAT